MKIHLPNDVTVPEVAAAMLSIGIRLKFKDGDLVVKERCKPAAGANGWRPISDPPVFLQDVLITSIDEDDNPMVEIGFRQGIGKMTEWRTTDMRPVQPIAWMPIPSPYTGVKK